MTRVVGGGVTTKNPFGNVGTSKQTAQAETLGQQVQQELFGRKKPRVLDVDDADIAAQLARLHAYRKKIARLAGDAEDDYSLALADDTIAMIDGTGKIYFGKRFLLAHADDVDLLVGVLAHEIGHRPKRWAQHKRQQPRTREQLHELCRLEETYADFFAGRALAELGLSPASMCRLLVTLEEDADSDRPHPEYFSAKLRGEVIMDGFKDGQRQTDQRRKLFPELAKHLNAKLDLGTG